MQAGQIDALLTLITYFSIFYFHEAGHYYVARYYNTKSVTVVYERELFLKVPHRVIIDDPDVESSRRKLIFIRIGGILAGLIPIVLLHIIVEPFFEIVPLVIGGFYIIHSCAKDFGAICNLVIKNRSVA